MIEIVTVDRPDIVETELLEERAAGHETDRMLEGAIEKPRYALRQILRDEVPDAPDPREGAAGEPAREIGGHRADGRRDRHVVVVQNHDQARLACAGVVHRLIRHAGGE